MRLLHDLIQQTIQFTLVARVAELEFVTSRFEKIQAALELLIRVLFHQLKLSLALVDDVELLQSDNGPRRSRATMRRRVQHQSVVIE
jgi:hypothetical protein